MSEGLRFTGSPGWNIWRTFSCQFNFEIRVQSNFLPKKIYRNPIYIAKEYKKILDSGEVKNQADLARMKDISRARVTQVLNLLKLDKSILNELKEIGGLMDKKFISERILRNFTHKKQYYDIDFW